MALKLLGKGPIPGLVWVLVSAKAGAISASRARPETVRALVVIVVFEWWKVELLRHGGRDCRHYQDGGSRLGGVEDDVGDVGLIPDKDAGREDVRKCAGRNRKGTAVTSG
jgi:hypothetical protein